MGTPSVYNFMEILMKLVNGIVVFRDLTKIIQQTAFSLLSSVQTRALLLIFLAIYTPVRRKYQIIVLYWVIRKKSTSSPEEDKQYAVETSRSTSSDDVVRKTIIL